MVTGQGSVTPIIVFAQSKDGHRMPMEVSVAPVKNASGKVVGGVETFRDLSSQFHDIERAQRIQLLSLQEELPENERISFSAHYASHDVIGGDYYAVTPLDADHYGFLLADVTGHGVPAALYTMYLNSLWQDNHHLVSDPPVFADIVNKKLYNLIKEGAPFAASICGVFDLKQGRLRLSSAGNPPPLLIRSDGEYDYPDCRGLPLGVMEDATYDETVLDIRRGDCILFFTDGAIEIADPKGKQLGLDGLVTILESLGYPQSAAGFTEIEAALLRYSDRIRLDDDVTFLEARLA
jgi:serine phosphatase RsbU (regulator of sigma subunit)